MTPTEFLTWLRPAGPWLLTTICPDTKATETASFGPETADACAAWVDERNEKVNIYFHLNPDDGKSVDEGGRRKKAARRNITALEFVHVDIDPPETADLVGAQADISASLTDKRPAEIPAPSAIIFSGGGYQAIWRLDDPIKLDGTIEAAELAKLHSLTLERTFRADNCHNIDRIMRLPGTWNLPTARKIKMGRSKQLARLRDVNDRSYPLATFPQAAPLATTSDARYEKIELTGDVHPVMDVAELDPYGVPDRLKLIMAQGTDGTVKLRDNSSSAWLFDFLCECVRHKVPNEMLYSIILDREWGISDHIYGRFATPEAAHDYALRQISRAVAFARDENLAKMNEEYSAVTDMGGKFRILHESYNETMDRRSVSFMPKKDFMDSFENKFFEARVAPDQKEINKNKAALELLKTQQAATAAELAFIDAEIERLDLAIKTDRENGAVGRAAKNEATVAKHQGKKLKLEAASENINIKLALSEKLISEATEGEIERVNIAKWWLTNEDRREYSTVEFFPGYEFTGKAYNLWRGFSAEERPGDCSKFLDHIKANVCQNDEAQFAYVLNWVALMVQQPAKVPGVALVLLGQKGVGKGIFVNKLGDLVREHYTHITNAEHLVGKFNSHLQSTLLLFVDEAFYSGDKKHESVLKGLVTEPTVPIERKGIDVTQARNFLHIVFASNDLDSAVPASADERRYCVLDVGNEKQQDGAYFKALDDEWKNGGRDAFFYMMRHRDIKNWNAGKIPPSAGLTRQKISRLESFARFWWLSLHRGFIGDNLKSWPERTTTDELLVHYNTYRRDNTGGGYTKLRETDAAEIGRFLSKVLPSRRVVQSTEGRQYELPDLAAARQEFNEWIGGDAFDGAFPTNAERKEAF